MKFTFEQKIAMRLRTLQSLLQMRFGNKSTSHSGEHTIFISPDKITLTNERCDIVARGPVRIATVLVRKKRRAK